MRLINRMFIRLNIRPCTAAAPDGIGTCAWRLHVGKHSFARRRPW